MKALFSKWNSFWFESQSTLPLALTRIAYATVALGYVLSLGPDLLALFSDQGLLGRGTPGPQNAGVLSLDASSTTVIVLYAVLVLSVICMLIGYQTRLSSVLVFLGIFTLQRRNPFMLNGGDGLMRLLGLYLLATPCGACLSVDSWRSNRAYFWEAPKRAPWGLRLIQIQLSLVYLFTVWAKVRGSDWHAGVAVSYALRLEDFVRFPLPTAFTKSLFLSNVMSYSTLALELSLAILIWNKGIRPYLLPLGVLMHVGIAFSLMVGFFSEIVLVGYLAFIAPETMSRLVSKIRERLRVSKVKMLRHVAAAASP